MSKKPKKVGIRYDMSGVYTLRDFANRNANDPKFYANINAAADQLERRIVSSPKAYGRYPQYPTDVKLVQQALSQYQSNPGKYAKAAYIPSENGYKPLDPNDSSGPDWKCNRFVADMVIAAGGDYPVHRYGDYRDMDPRGNLPATAEEVYANGNLKGMRSIDAKEARVGDIISFPGHIGIYLGNGVYVSAKEGGVEITKVPWDQSPRFRRVEERVNQRSHNSTDNNYSLQNVSSDPQLNQTINNNLSKAMENLKLTKEEQVKQPDSIKDTQELMTSTTQKQHFL
jgi:NlpC/P60 family